jgi:oligopeptide transport system ATP-binding protein
LFKGAKIHGVSKAQHKNLTRSMQMIYQDPYASLNPFFTIGEIISEGLEIHKLYDGSKENQKRVYELLEMVGLHKSHINRFPHEFSGGQRQRVGIARALAVNPEFIICDEAISALDVSIQAQIINLLIDLQKNLNLTYLFIAHDLAMVRHISDNTAVMYLGSLVEIGETDAVYKNPLHPYTKGLIDAVPVADPEYEANRVKSNIKGEISNLTNLPDGCRFYPRCEVANEVCKHKNPVLREIYNGHYVACHYYNEV